MFSLIITIFAIALVIALILVTVYYGGPIFMKNGAKIAAETLVNQSLQIAAAQQLASAQGRALPGGATVSLPTDLLRAMPTPPASAYVDGSPSPSDWEYYVPGVSSHFGLSAKISKTACMEVNKGQGFIGIPAAWDGTSAIQCFGPSPTGYTYLFQPTGTTPQQRDAVLQATIDAAKPVIPTVTAGYPRLCPDGETISAGVCDGSSEVAKPTGFWVITATAGGWSTALSSVGYATTCPAGAVDPTSSAAQPAPSQAGEAFNVDGLVDLAWTLPPDYESTFQSPTLSRTWCIPANEDDVLDSVADQTYHGGVEGVTQVVLPAGNDTDPEAWPSSSNKTALITAGGKQWTLLASLFSTDTDNRTNGDSLSMVGRKVAIGNVPGATQSYFVNSPAISLNGVQYQNTVGTITFPAPQPPCVPLVKNAPLGTGGRIVELVGGDTPMMLKEDGSVWTAGSGYDGLIGNCSFDDRYTWTRVATGATKIMSDMYAHYFIKADGTVWATGDLSIFLGDDFWEVPRFTQLPISNVVDIRGGVGAVYMKRSDGSIWQLGKEIFDVRDLDFSTPVQIDSNVDKYYPDTLGMYVIKNDRSLWYTRFGSAPSKISDDVVDVAPIDGYIYVKTDGTVYAKGHDISECGKAFGQGASTTTTYLTPTQIAMNVGPVAEVSASPSYTVLHGVDGTLWAAGCNDRFREISFFGDGTFNDRPTFSQMATGVKLFRGNFIVNMSGALFANGYNYSGQFGNGTDEGSLQYIPVAY